MSLIKINKLGEGSFGSVWKYKKTGLHRSTNEQYFAIKFFKDDINNTYLNPPDTFDFTVNSNCNNDYDIDDSNMDDSDIDDSDNDSDNNSDNNSGNNSYNNNFSRLSANFFKNL